MAKLINTIFILSIIAILGIAGAVIWKIESKLPPLQYSEFLESLDKNEIQSVHLKGGEISITDIYGRQFSTYSPDVSGLMPKLIEKQVAITAESNQKSPLWNALVTTVPIVFILIIWFFLMKGQQDKETESSEFAKDKAVNFKGGGKHVTFRDVAGIPEAKEELLEIIDFLQNPRKFSRLGAIIPRGVLFQGPPGTGKTLLARAIAGEAGVPFYSISGSDFVEMFVGVGASRVRDLFREAKKNSPCIIFIDEIDAVGGHRAAGGTAGGQDERGQTLNALLVEMDGFASDETVIVLAATNRPDILDPALLRPGRFDRQITILPPDVKGRMQILQVHTSKVVMAEGVTLEDLARSTPGFTGAELANLVNEAALVAGRRGKKAIDQDDFEAAKDRILMGVERKGYVINDKDRRTMAIHEAGHAILAKFLPETDPLHKITIIPRGKAMGHTQQLPLQDRHAYSKQYLRSRIAILMGGRAAEEVVFHEQSTGAEDDFLQAVEIASNMVCRWGMDEVIGTLSYVKRDEGYLSGQRAIIGHSEETARIIDQEVKKLIDECYQEAVRVLEKEKTFLVHLAEILLQTETLDAEEMQIIFECSRRKDQELGTELAVKECMTKACPHCTPNPFEI